MSNIVPRTLVTALPAALAEAPDAAHLAIERFFEVKISNRSTRRTYRRGAMDLLVYAVTHGADRLGAITPFHVAAWLADLEAQGLSVPTIKSRLAGVRMLFQSLVRDGIIDVNPAELVKAPRFSAMRGKTPVLTGEETLKLLGSIDTDTLIGLRDRALMGCMAYSFARIGAVVALKVKDVFHQKRRLWLRLQEKRGRRLQIPCHHQFENYLLEYMERAGIKDRQEAPLFQSVSRHGKRPKGGDRKLSGRALTQGTAWEMLQRRARQAGLQTRVCNHTFRATGITAYLSNGGTIERAANMAGHASTRTTQLYDRRSDEVTLEEVEKIRFS